jgi:hypothetical protein
LNLLTFNQLLLGQGAQLPFVVFPIAVNSYCLLALHSDNDSAKANRKKLMFDSQDTVIRFLGRRPTSCLVSRVSPIPPDATIYYGLERLLGSQQDGMELAWSGWSVTACSAYYAAVLTDDPHATDLRARNRAAGGIVVEYITMSQVRLALADHYQNVLNMSSVGIKSLMASMDESALWRQYVARGLHIDRAGAPGMPALA